MRKSDCELRQKFINKYNIINLNSIILYTSDAIDYTNDVKAYLEKGTN